MGLNNDYAYEVNNEETDVSTSEDEEEVELDPETWQDYNSEHLLNMYMSLIEYCESQGLPFMRNLPFNDFIHFIYNRAV